MTPRSRQAPLLSKQNLDAILVGFDFDDRDPFPRLDAVALEEFPDPSTLAEKPLLPIQVGYHRRQRAPVNGDLSPGGARSI